MLPKTHFILGLFFSAIIFYFFPQIGLFGAGIIFLSSLLIDFDHYLFYVILKKDTSLKRAYKWHLIKRQEMRKLSRSKRNKYKDDVLILHGMEPLILLYFLSFLWSPFIFILIGFSFHIILDIFDEIRFNDRIDKVSVIWDVIKYKELKKTLLHKD